MSSQSSSNSSSEAEQVNSDEESIDDKIKRLNVYYESADDYKKITVPFIKKHSDVNVSS
jgi:predicted DNA binding CopG/RHH family protein